MTYDPANSFSSAERIRALLDPVFISEQGLAKAIALHDAYFGLVGRVSAPANLLWEGRSIPKKISDLTCVKSGNNVVLAWTVPTKNIYNEDLAVTHCQVYRGTTPNFVAGPSNLLADDVVGTTYTDTDALLATTVDYYYRVLGKSSGLAPVSNMGYKLNYHFNYYAGKTNGNKYSLPYRQSAATNLRTICENIITVTLSTGCGWINPATDLSVSGTKVVFPPFWIGDNTAWVEGAGYYSNIKTPGGSIIFVGSHDDSFVHSFTYYPAAEADKGRLISLPYHHSYTSAAQLLADIPNCTQVGWDYPNGSSGNGGVFYVWPSKTVGQESSEIIDNFIMPPGLGIRIRLSADSTWKPKVY